MNESTNLLDSSFLDQHHSAKSSLRIVFLHLLAKPALFLSLTFLVLKLLNPHLPL